MVYTMLYHVPLVTAVLHYGSVEVEFVQIGFGLTLYGNLEPNTGKLLHLRGN